MLNFLNEALASLKTPTKASGAAFASLPQLQSSVDNGTVQPTHAISGPTALHVFATHRCQLACSFCPGHSPLLQPNLAQQLTRRELDLDTFRYVWRQYPTLQSVLFSGWGEPLLNAQVLAMADHAWQDRQAPSTMVTNGLLLDIHQDILMMSEGLTLVVSLNGHSPSSYRTCTGMDPGNFSDVCEQVRRLTELRQKRSIKQPEHPYFKIELSFLVGADTLPAIPAMIELAYELGVDGVRFNNILGVDPMSPRNAHSQTLFLNHDSAMETLTKLAIRKYPLPVSWPVPVSASAGGKGQCTAPHTVLTLDGDCNQGNCMVLPNSTQWSGDAHTLVKGWDADAWTSEPLQQLREIHSPQNTAGLPAPCQQCTHNCG